MANKMAIRIAHFLAAIASGALVAYSFYYFRSNVQLYEAAGAGLVAATMVIILLPRLHRSGGGGGD